MYTDEQIPRELERYMAQARRMRSEYLAGLFRRGFAALARAVRNMGRTRTVRKPVMKGTAL